MILFNFFVFLGCFILYMIGMSIFEFYKHRIKDFCLNTVYWLQAKSLLSNRKSAFDVVSYGDAVKVHKRNEIDNKIKQLKKQDEPITLEVAPNIREWHVKTINIQTLEYETIEIPVRVDE